MTEIKLQKGQYLKNGYICQHKEHHHVCVNCGKEYTSYKKNQKLCSKSCSNSYSGLRKKSLDVDIFEGAIDTPEKAYLLGLIVTDGSIIENKNNIVTTKRLDITLKDEYLIQQLRDAYSPTKKVSHNRGCYTFRNNNDNTIAFLESLGIVPAKTYDVAFDYSIADELMPHYLRGLFDGDGCAYISRNGKDAKGKPREYLFLSFTSGSQLFATQLCDYLNSIGIEARINLDSRRKDSERKTYYVQIKKKASVRKFYDFIYQEEGLHLFRKKAIFDNHYNDDIVE